jgi:hypothetical protein
VKRRPVAGRIAIDGQKLKTAGTDCAMLFHRAIHPSGKWIKTDYLV